MDDPNETFVVVDKNDKILGYRSRYQCHHDRSIIHRVAGVILFNNKGKILLQKRSLTKDTDPGLYTISTCGHVSRGETYKQAAKRELFEELGISTEIKRFKKFIITVPIETEMEVLFIGKCNGPFKINKDEVTEVDFFSFNQIKDMYPQLTAFAIENFKQMNIISNNS